MPAGLEVPFICSAKTTSIFPLRYWGETYSLSMSTLFNNMLFPFVLKSCRVNGASTFYFLRIKNSSLSFIVFYLFHIDYGVCYFPSRSGKVGKSIVLKLGY